MVTGGCQCGAVRYEVTEPPLALYICHCLECRRQSASAFGMSLEVPRSGFRLVSGSPRSWRRPADSGNSLTCHFCPDCGSRIWHERSADSPSLTVKAGTLDQPVDAATAIHIWTDRKLPGIEIPSGVKQFPGEPDS